MDKRNLSKRDICTKCITEELWPLYQQWKGIDTPESSQLIEEPYYIDGTGKKPRYYQRMTINRAVEAIVKGQNRILLVDEPEKARVIEKITSPEGAKVS